MTLKYGRACALCMLSEKARAILTIEWFREMAEKRLLDHYDDCTIAEQSVVDKPAAALSSKEDVIRRVLFEGIDKGNFSALILCGDMLTEFGQAMQTAATRENIPVHPLGFGPGPFGQQYRQWYGREARKRQARRENSVWASVDEAEVIGLHIC